MVAGAGRQLHTLKMAGKGMRVRCTSPPFLSITYKFSGGCPGSRGTIGNSHTPTLRGPTNSFNRAVLFAIETRCFRSFLMENVSVPFFYPVDSPRIKEKSWICTSLENGNSSFLIGDFCCLVQMLTLVLCSAATNRLITAKDHASVQINIGHVDENGHIIPGQQTTYALCGFVRTRSESDDSLNRLATQDNLLEGYEFLIDYFPICKLIRS